MRLAWMVLIAWLAALPALAQNILEAPAKPRELSHNDTRLLQGALALEGLYNGRLDGQWGAQSDRALAAYLQATNARAPARNMHLAALAAGFLGQVRKNGWAIVNEAELGMSYFLPLGTLERTGSSTNGTYRTANGDLQLSIKRDNLGEALVTHGQIQVRQTSNAGRQAYTVREGNRWITSADLPDGWRVYALSLRIGGEFSTSLLQWKAAHDKSAQLILASMTAGEQSVLKPERGAELQRMLRAFRAAEPGGAVRPAEPKSVVDASSRVRRIWTGIYINNTDLVTAADAIRACPRLELEDGTRVRALRTGPLRGLVMATSNRRSTSWMSLSAPDGGGGDQLVSMLSYKSLNPSLNLLVASQNRITEALNGAEANERFFIVRDAAHHPAGSPVLNKKGELIAILAQSKDRTGNNGERLAMSAKTLANSLDDAQILFADRANKRVPETTGSISLDTSAIVPLFCQSS